MHRLFIHCSDMTNFSQEKKYETILAIVLGLLVISLFTNAKALVIASAILAFVGLMIPMVSGWITWLWLKISHVMGWVMSKVIMSIVFYLVLFPISVLAKLSKKDQLKLKKSNEPTYYTTRNYQYSPEELENPW